MKRLEKLGSVIYVLHVSAQYAFMYYRCSKSLTYTELKEGQEQYTTFVTGSKMVCPPLQVILNTKDILF